MQTQVKNKVDPSEIQQVFHDFQIKIHCCRYWKIKEWEFNNMAFPFWRMYYNTIKGARIYFEDNVYELSPENIYLIPPNTSFSTTLKQTNINHKTEYIQGSRIASVYEIKSLQALEMVDHLFIHFNLGIQYDNLKKGIYSFATEAQSIRLTNQIKTDITVNYKQISLNTNLKINTLLMFLLEKIPTNFWNIERIDSRVEKIINYIEQNLSNDLSNKHLASLINMAPNSFLRIFKSNTGFSIQQYIQKRRIEEASVTLHHSTETMDEIASNYGFCDRYHFSKIFRKLMGVSPARYRRRLY